MFTKRVPGWVYATGGGLAASAGFVNAVGLAGMAHQAVSHVSGTVTRVGLLLGGDRDSAVAAGLVVVAFGLGSVLSGALIGDARLQLRRRYGVALLIQSGLLFGATGLLMGGHASGEYLAAAACGLQNAMATSYSGAVIRTTHMTGVVTDLGILIGQALRYRRLPMPRLLLYLTLLGGFLTGGVLGGLAFGRLGARSLLLPAVGSAVIGLLYGIFLRRRHAEHPLPHPDMQDAAPPPTEATSPE